HARASEDATVTFDFIMRPKCLFEIIGELDSRPAVSVIELADEAGWIEGIVSTRITVAKIICQQSAPTCAEAYAPFWKPLISVEEIISIAEIVRRSTVAYGSGKVCVQLQNFAYIQ